MSESETFRFEDTIAFELFTAGMGTIERPNPVEYTIPYTIILGDPNHSASATKIVRRTELAPVEYFPKHPNKSDSVEKAIMKAIRKTMRSYHRNRVDELRRPQWKCVVCHKPADASGVTKARPGPSERQPYCYIMPVCLNDEDCHIEAKEIFWEFATHRAQQWLYEPDVIFLRRLRDGEISLTPCDI